MKKILKLGTNASCEQIGKKQQPEITLACASVTQTLSRASPSWEYTIAPNFWKSGTELTMNTGESLDKNTKTSEQIETKTSAINWKLPTCRKIIFRFLPKTANFWQRKRIKWGGVRASRKSCWKWGFSLENHSKLNRPMAQGGSLGSQSKLPYRIWAWN